MDNFKLYSVVIKTKNNYEIHNIIAENVEQAVEAIKMIKENVEIIEIHLKIEDIIVAFKNNK